MGQHWYDENGEAQHTQIVKSGVRKGQERDTNLGDAKKLGLRPSVTGIIDVMDKGYGLTNWMCKEAVKKALDPDYVPRDTAKEGSIIHNIIEVFIKTGLKEKAGLPYITAVEEVFEKYGATNPETEITFATGDVGGSVDCPDRTANIIFDWKSKDFDEIPEDVRKKFVYDSHAMQLSPYREGLEMPTARCINVFLSRTTAGLWCAYEHTEEEIVRGGEMFKHCLALWKLKHNVA